MTRKALKISIICMIVALVVATGSVFAYFSYLGQAQNANVDLTGATSTEVNVAGLEDLIRYGTDPKYNAGVKLSAVANRYVLKLTADITLNTDLTLTNDVLIDLNGHTLTLNSCNLTIDHTYVSQFIVSNGYINSVSNDDTKGKIYVSTVSQEMTYGLFNGLNVKRNAGSYASSTQAISDIVKQTGYNEADILSSAETFVRKNMNNLYRRDIELITSYKLYDIDFEYSSNSQYVTSSGKVTLPTAPQTGNDLGASVTLTLTLTGPTATRTATFDFTVLAQSVIDDTTSGTLAQKFLTDYLSSYLVDGVYILNTDIILPKHNSYLGIDFSFACSPSSHSVETTSGSTTKYFLNDMVNGSVVVGQKFSPSGYVGTLTLTPTATLNGVDVVLSPYTFSASAQSNSDKAILMMQEVIPFLIKPNKTTIPLFSSQLLAQYGASSFTCTFSANNNYTSDDQSKTYYEYDSTNNVIKISTAGVFPPTETEINATIVFTFANGTPQTVTLTNRIYYDATGSDGGTPTDDVYRAVYNKILTAYAQNANSGNTYNSFTLPTYLDGFQIYYEDASTHSWLTINNSGNDNTAVFTIDKANVPDSKQNVTLNIKFGVPGQTDFTTTPVKKTLSLIVPGIIHNIATQVADTNLYNAMLGAYDANTDTVLTVDEAAVVKANDYRFSVSGLNIASFKGIEYLTGTSGFNLSNSGLTNAAFAYLATIEDLTYLDVSSNSLTATDLAGLTDGFYKLNQLVLDGNSIDNYDSIPLIPSLTILSGRNCSTTDIKGIRSVKNLVSLDLSSDSDSQTKNAIYLYLGFRPLLDMTKLITLYCYNNAPTDANYQTGNLITSTYGAYNLSVFVILSDTGKQVYYRNVAGQPQDIAADITAWQREGAYLMEGIVFYRYGGQDSNTKVFYTPTTIGSYTINWKFDSLGTGANASSLATVDASTQSVTHTAAGRAQPYEVYGSVTIGGVSEQTVYRPFLLYVATGG